MSSTFAIALGVPARHIEAIATARSRLLADIGAHCYDQRWHSWIPVCTVSRLGQNEMQKLRERFTQLPLATVAPAQFAVRCASLVVEFAGGDGFDRFMEGLYDAIVEAVGVPEFVIPGPARAPVLSSHTPGAVELAHVRAADLVLPDVLLPITDLLFYEQTENGGWHRLNGEMPIAA